MLFEESGSLCFLERKKIIWNTMAENYVEKVLLKIVRQLNTFDEDSLVSLWPMYADKVQVFEPSKQWEEAVLVLSLIQAIRMKNQLFNCHWLDSRDLDSDRSHLELADLLDKMRIQKDVPDLQKSPPTRNAQKSTNKKKKKTAQILEFKPKGT